MFIVEQKVVKAGQLSSVLTKNWIFSKKAHLRIWKPTYLASKQVLMGASTRCSSSRASEVLVDVGLMPKCLSWVWEGKTGLLVPQLCPVPNPQSSDCVGHCLARPALNITLHSHNYNTDVFHSHQNYNASFNKFLQWQPKCLGLIGNLLYLPMSVSLHTLIQLSGASMYSWQLIY